MIEYSKIKTTISYKNFSRVEYWELERIYFYDYKSVFKKHFLSTNFSKIINESKNKINKKIDRAKNIDEIIKVFYETGIKIYIDYIL